MAVGLYCRFRDETIFLINYQKWPTNMKIKEMAKNFPQEYIENILDYSGLKRRIKSNFSEEEESAFRTDLDSEILKSYTFINNTHISILSKAESVEYEDEEACNSLNDEIYVFSEFIRVNVLALKRILTRHDKFTGFVIMDQYKRQIKEKNLEIKNLLGLISSINTKKSKGKNGTFISEKYWVPSENLVNLKLGILKHLKKSRFVDEARKLDDSYVNTIYLDNADFDLYTRFINYEPLSFFIRLRWFGPKASDVICELKDCTNNSLKSINIPEKHVLDFLNGKDVYNVIKNNSREVYDEIRNKIKGMKLRPVLRTFFRRCIFEDPENSKVRINLDSNIVMIKEATDQEFNMNSFPLNRWKRSDISHDWPFRNLGSSEIVRFPYSIIEVINESNDDADWIQNLLSQGKIEKIERFSKYIHGTGLLFPSNTTMPPWLPQTIDRDDEGVVSRSKVEDDVVHVQGESEMSFEMSPYSEDRSKIAIPVRVEPKVFFANERTFLSWVQFAIFLGGIGTAMIGLGDARAYLCGVMLIGVAGVFAFYALYLFHYRALRIRVKDPGPYDDMMGPMILVGIFVFVMVLSFIFKFPIKKTGLKTQ